MATIKRNGNLIVLKSGKVSCTCCGGGCCMYPAQALADGEYTVDDLPDEVFGTEDRYTSGLLTKLDPPTVFPGGEIQYYNNPESGGIYLLPDVGLWTDEAGFERQCLISFFIEDQFADTYTATDPQGNPPITLTRESLCVWRGPEPDLYTLRYLDDSASEGFKCKWAFIDSIKDEGQFQNTPTGNYTQPEQENPWVIS